jgi:hypothetical protein
MATGTPQTTKRGQLSRTSLGRVSSPNNSAYGAVENVASTLGSLLSETLNASKEGNIAKGINDLSTLQASSITENKSVTQRFKQFNDFFKNNAEEYSPAELVKIRASVPFINDVKLANLGGDMVNVNQAGAALGKLPDRPSNTPEDIKANTIEDEIDIAEQKSKVIEKSFPVTSGSFKTRLLDPFAKLGLKHNNEVMQISTNLINDASDLSNSISKLVNNSVTISNLDMQTEMQARTLSDIKLNYTRLASNLRGSSMINLYNASDGTIAKNAPYMVLESLNTELADKISKDEGIRNALGSKGVDAISEMFKTELSNQDNFQKNILSLGDTETALEALVVDSRTRTTIQQIKDSDYYSTLSESVQEVVAKGPAIKLLLEMFTQGPGPSTAMSSELLKSILSKTTTEVLNAKVNSVKGTAKLTEVKGLVDLLEEITPFITDLDTLTDAITLIEGLKLPKDSKTAAEIRLRIRQIVPKWNETIKSRVELNKLIPSN